MRGKLGNKLTSRILPRITPAGAGKTAVPILRINIVQDHPRRCGENLPPHLQLYKTTGSPPQVRGKLVDGVNANHGDRITPAGAGKTLPLYGSITPNKDHPRRCGENLAVRKSICLQTGSPPQVRGKRVMRGVVRTSPGITPAGAGKTI